MHGAFHHKHILKYNQSLERKLSEIQTLTIIVIVSTGLPARVFLQNPTTETQNRHIIAELSGKVTEGIQYRNSY